MSQDFYLTLSSNASERFYPDNTLTHFFNKLPETIDLRHPRDWEVGLAECRYPYNWFNLQDGEGELELFREVQEEGDAVQVFRQEKDSRWVLHITTRIRQQTEQSRHKCRAPF
ncbi:hypothetical protein BaRGS_00039135 [Batillaria attramentaria]|uniref:Uncharacterized protein n=1 Tax=Batillaria attramentaria TaxID=370345 RepID=A0ABD0J469_9CAEN